MSFHSHNSQNTIFLLYNGKLKKTSFFSLSVPSVQPAILSKQGALSCTCHAKNTNNFDPVFGISVSCASHVVYFSIDGMGSNSQFPNIAKSRTYTLMGE